MKSFVAIAVFLAVTSAFSVDSNERDDSFFSIQNRISGGEKAEVGQFPHQVGVQTHRLSEDNWDYTAFCGGSLISDQFVLTAAHCLHGGIFAEIFMGVTNFTGATWVRMNVEKDNMIIHEKYDPIKIRNDIALAKLPSKVPFSALPGLIKTINLPRLSQRQSSFEKTVGWIIGWGRTGDTGIKASSLGVLHYARRWILPDEYCYHDYPSYDKSIEICVDGSHGISACPGDSGGPVFIEEENGSRTVIGVASYERYEGCEKGFPVVYTRTTAYLDWIVEKTGITLRD